jgi:hypothetical protein
MSASHRKRSKRSARTDRCAASTPKQRSSVLRPTSSPKTDTTLQALVDRYGRNIAAKLILSVAWFNLLSRFLNGTRVPLETGNAYEGRTSPI